MTPAARVAVANGYADEVTCWSEMTNGSHMMQILRYQSRIGRHTETRPTDAI